jgi:hypothetical protein
VCVSITSLFYEEDQSCQKKTITKSRISLDDIREINAWCEARETNRQVV